MTVYYSNEDTYCEDCKPTLSEAVYNPETDYPIHCYECDDLISCNLTPDGVECVIEAIESYLISGGGRPEILAQWAIALQEYSLSDDDQEIIDEFHTVMMEKSNG